MSKKSRFRECFDKQYGKCGQTLLKSASQHLYHIHWSLARKLCSKKSLLLTCQIFGLLVNTLATDEKYLVLNRDNLKIPIQMQLSQKQKIFSEILSEFLKSRLNFEHLWKKHDPHSFCSSEMRDSENVLDKGLKMLVSEDPSTSNMVHVTRHCWNLYHSTFIIFIGQCQWKCVRKSLLYWHAKSLHCLLTHWLPTKSILFLIETI